MSKHDETTVWKFANVANIEHKLKKLSRNIKLKRKQQLQTSKVLEHKTRERIILQMSENERIVETNNNYI